MGENFASMLSGSGLPYAEWPLDSKTYSLHKQASCHPPGVKAVIHSPRKGTHRPAKIDARSAKKQLRCRKCSKLTTFKCSKCGSLKRPVPLCGEKTGRNCWEDFHDSRIYDQGSCQGMMFSGSTNNYDGTSQETV